MATTLFLFLACVTVHARPNEVQPSCTETQQDDMQTAFQSCLDKFTKVHHEEAAKAKTIKEYQVSEGKNNRKSFFRF
jgi:hypothetical protein